MPVTETTDAELRNLIFANEKVIVKFTKSDCVVCEKMGKTYLKLSNEPQFKDVTFLLMDSDENPVSSQEVKLTGTPFFAIYQKGFLSKCQLIDNEPDLEDFLKELLHQDHKS